MDILTLNNVSKVYGELKALDSVNLSVAEGEWIYYYQNGKESKEMNFAAGKREGKQQEFYENGNDEILQSSSKNNKESLKEYLNSFSLEEYCCEMLQIDDYDFIKKLINNGGKKIDSINVNNYLDIAIEFWEKRKATIDTYINK